MMPHLIASLLDGIMAVVALGALGSWVWERRRD